MKRGKNRADNSSIINSITFTNIKLFRLSHSFLAFLKINVTGGKTIEHVNNNLWRSSKKYGNTQLKTLVFIKKLKSLLKKLDTCFYYSFLENKFLYILYIYYILLLVSSSSIKKVYCGGKKVFFSNIQHEKKSFSQKNRRRLYDSLTSNIPGGI